MRASGDPRSDALTTLTLQCEINIYILISGKGALSEVCRIYFEGLL